MELMFQFLINITIILSLVRSLTPVHIHEVWNYSQVNVENIKYPISNFNWSKAFEDFSADGKDKHLKKTLLNIFEFIFQLKKLSVIIVNLFGLMIT